MSSKDRIRQPLKTKYHKFLPYRKLRGKLMDFEVVLEKKIEEIDLTDKMPKIKYKFPKIKSEYVELKLIEVRNNKKRITSLINTKNHIMWGIKSFPLLKEIVVPLSDKLEYKWGQVEEIIINFLKTENKYKTFDYTLGSLTSFIGDVFRAKFEITGQDFEQFMDADDNYVKDIRLNVFSKLKVFKELINISSSKINNEEKGGKMIEVIIKHHNSFFMPKFAFYEPFYQDDFEPLFILEEDELSAMERLIYRELDKIEAEHTDDKDMQKILKDELFDTYYYKRLKSLSSRTVVGARLSFEEKENKKREEAQLICYELLNILVSWGIHDLRASRKCISVYWDLFEEKAWERQKKDMRDKKQENKWKQDLIEMKKIQTGQWDSNTLTLFGVIIAIFFSIFLGTPSLFKIEWYWALLLALAISFLLIIVFKLKEVRKFIIRNVK